MRHLGRDLKMFPYPQRGVSDRRHLHRGRAPAGRSRGAAAARPQRRETHSDGASGRRPWHLVHFAATPHNAKGAAAWCRRLPLRGSAVDALTASSCRPSSCSSAAQQRNPRSAASHRNVVPAVLVYRGWCILLRPRFAAAFSWPVHARPHSSSPNTRIQMHEGRLQHASHQHRASPLCARCGRACDSTHAAALITRSDQDPIPLYRMNPAQRTPCCGTGCVSSIRRRTSSLTPRQLNRDSRAPSGAVRRRDRRERVQLAIVAGFPGRRRLCSTDRRGRLRAPTCDRRRHRSRTACAWRCITSTIQAHAAQKDSLHPPVIMYLDGEPTIFRRCGGRSRRCRWPIAPSGCVIFLGVETKARRLQQLSSTRAANSGTPFRSIPLLSATSRASAGRAGRPWPAATDPGPCSLGR